MQNHTWLVAPVPGALEAGGFSGRQVDEKHVEVLKTIKRKMALKKKKKRKGKKF